MNEWRLHAAYKRKTNEMTCLIIEKPTTKSKSLTYDQTNWHDCFVVSFNYLPVHSEIMSKWDTEYQLQTTTIVLFKTCSNKSEWKTVAKTTKRTYNERDADSYGATSFYNSVDCANSSTVEPICMSFTMVQRVYEHN